CARNCISPDDLGRHKTRRTVDGAARLVIHSDVIVIADQDLASTGIEERVAERDVAITESLRVELKIAVREFQSRSGESAEARLDPALHQIDDASITPISQRHDVAKARRC